MEGRVDPAYDYQCRNRAGRLVRKDYPVMGSIGDHPILTMQPGESQDETIPVNRACDLSTPGKYTIQLVRRDPNNPKHGVAKSNKINITVVP